MRNPKRFVSKLKRDLNSKLARQSLMVAIIVAASLAGPVPSALAQSSDGNPLTRLSSRFMEGYETREPLQVRDQVLAKLEPVNSQSSVFLPSSRIRPLTMAVLALEAAEGVRDRVRYHITYGVERFPDLASGVPYPVSFIQVDRFSLGSAIRQDIINTYGGEHVGPPEAFDVGPHVSWRLVTRPVQGMASDIVAAGRTELSEMQAQEITCLNSPCLSAGMDLDDAAPWSVEEEMPLDADPVPFQVARGSSDPRSRHRPADAREQLWRGRAISRVL